MITRQRRIALAAGVAVLALLAGAATAWWTARAESSNASTAEMWKMRFDRPQGGQLAMADWRGKPIIINFWATWCAPCVKELPEVDRFQREVATARGVQVIGLAVDKADAVQSFLSRMKLGFPIGLAGLDGTDLINQLGNLQGGLPFSVMIDANGRVVHSRLGETSYAELKSWAEKQ